MPIIQCEPPESAAVAAKVKQARKRAKARAKGRSTVRVEPSERADPRLGITHKVRAVPEKVYFLVIPTSKVVYTIRPWNRLKYRPVPTTKPMLVSVRAFDAAARLTGSQPRFVYSTSDGPVFHLVANEWRAFRKRLGTPIVLTARDDQAEITRRRSAMETRRANGLPPRQDRTYHTEQAEIAKANKKLRDLGPSKFHSFAELAEAIK